MNTSQISNISQGVDRSTADLLTAPYISVCVLKIVVGVISIFLNIFVLKVISSGTQSWSVTVNFLRHNAIADIIIGVFIFYHQMYELLLYKNIQECVFRNASTCSIILGSMLIILGLNMEIYLQITRPLRYVEILSPRVVNTYLAVVWTLVIILSLTPSLMAIGAPPLDRYCRVSVLGKEFIFIFFTLKCLIILVQFFMYFHIFVIAVGKILKDRKRMRAVSAESKPKVLQWLKPTKPILMIILTNVGLLIPITIFMLLVAKEKLDHVIQEVQHDQERLVYLSIPCLFNTAINPILYAFQIPEVKRAFKNTFCCCRKKTEESRKKERRDAVGGGCLKT